MNANAWRVEYVEELDSTNTVVADRARHGEGEGLVLRADHQSQGRGRLGRSWEAASGSALLCSILVRPRLDSEHLQWAVVAVALSARAALGRLGVDCALKWPNDLLVGGEKVAGVLAEFVPTPSGPAIVVGLGVNVSDHPPHVDATDVARARGKGTSVEELLEGILDELGRRRPLLDTPHGLATLADEYRAALVTIGQRVRVHERDGEWEGLAYDVDSAGHLLVHVDRGERTVVAGDVVHVRPVAS